VVARLLLLPVLQYSLFVVNCYKFRRSLVFQSTFTTNNPSPAEAGEQARGSINKPIGNNKEERQGHSNQRRPTRATSAMLSASGMAVVVRTIR
jgi:hypothetical protein